MSNAPVDNSRRRFLTIATSVVGGVGAVGAAVPFIASWNPSERAKSAGAPVEVDISKLESGQLIRVEWRGKPVWIVNRTPKMLEQMKQHEDKLRDPNSEEPQQLASAQNGYRSKRPELFVAVGICTHLGCSPSFLNGSFGEKVEGTDSGFFCPCHGSKFDMAGRVFQNVPAPLNLEIPPYTFIDDTTILVGEEEGVA
ncbi:MULTISPECIES: ubiquinol-cytochrome c reductase iron-sulfur subunit [Pseudoalteromonas]|jgi:ubiquinol-cytochrome c reductase iron-sulfur subunit|uniref:Ubiquinol-cytochrome c reductase iron-sulfur subunit n=1 Tax=Pseudoalteromonas maricaloris TaxID=184924 RepID=A0A8I2GZV7_9GAMM|nr:MULTISPECIES: ubiquinol-cytochrome c reductase iron-sulfur subunit [Pseudoalteromonas]KID37682.1 ubiquinol-cytochrome C reductase [Pseudoalteromonas flavipulchra NCIMB 2033 = ATCC BAA-314]KJZ05369.1 ubiquinol-cytochrome C reductase [Pseudoalteromonas piscicida]MBD0783880.1 ubiquinol-cytochrome c reductase iron-sulfur subunit [Pseudoalteromonas flavipulchra]MBE0374459.1 ubiquinol-cytochrome c reductase iron-sulfur subunit [Pseudoalteromonas flavipulchra NCIMB 2033 = ATCC BAA-314]MCG7541696.1